MNIQANQLRSGMVIVVDGDLYRVHDFQHVTPGKGQAVMQTRLRDLRSGSIVDRRFRATESVERAHIDTREVQYLYQEGELYTFMDTETFEQVFLRREAIEEALPYLVPNLVVEVDFYDEEPVGIELPKSVDLEVVETEPALKGATATASTKPATLETGLVVQVPPFVARGEVVRVDTSTGEYVTRVKETSV